MNFSKKQLATEIRKEAQVLNLHMGAVEAIIEKVVERVDGWSRDRTVITRDDLERKVAQEIGRYNKDLAYLYKNRGKII